MSAAEICDGHRPPLQSRVEKSARLVFLPIRITLRRMQVVTSVAAMQRLAKKWQKAGTKNGLVPTMGYLHAGHLSLVQRARKLVGKNGKVAVSIYVNPTQFGPKEDLSRYPRDLKRDLKLCRDEGVDVVFV